MINGWVVKSLTDKGKNVLKKHSKSDHNSRVLVLCEEPFTVKFILRFTGLKKGLQKFVTRDAVLLGCKKLMVDCEEGIDYSLEVLQDE